MIKLLSQKKIPPPHNSNTEEYYYYRPQPSIAKQGQQRPTVGLKYKKVCRALKVTRKHLETRERVQPESGQAHQQRFKKKINLQDHHHHLPQAQDEVYSAPAMHRMKPTFTSKNHNRLFIRRTSFLDSDSNNNNTPLLQVTKADTLLQNSGLEIEGSSPFQKRLQSKTVFPIEIRLSQINPSNEDHTDEHSVVENGSATRGQVVENQGTAQCVELVTQDENQDTFSCGKHLSQIPKSRSRQKRVSQPEIATEYRQYPVSVARLMTKLQRRVKSGSL